MAEVSWQDTCLAYLQIGALGVFLADTVGRSLRFRSRRHSSPIVLRLRKRGLLGPMEVALFLSVNLWALVVLLHVLPSATPATTMWFGPPLVGGALARWLGAVLTFAAFGLRRRAISALGDSWRLGLDDRHPGELVTTGVYAFSRNPIYLFFDLWFVGTFLMNGTAILLLFAAFVVANLHYQILHEERFLSECFGRAYESYRSRTGRYATLRRSRFPRGHLKVQGEP
jgi:protein-S-isoprenylcysteine O-methyltransferase Ste14